MSIATTIERVLACVAAVPGVGNVYGEVSSETNRADAEAARNVLDGSSIQSWEFTFSPVVKAHGADGYIETELEVEFVAHYRHTAGDATSLAAFRELLAAVGEALLTPDTGLPQVTEDGIVPVEVPERPVKLPTGQSAWRARNRFRLWDTSST